MKDFNPLPQSPQRTIIQNVFFACMGLMVVGHQPLQQINALIQCKNLVFHALT